MRKRHVSSTLDTKNDHFTQDRLGTNIGESTQKSVPFSWQTVSAGALRSGSRSRRYTSASSARRLRRTSGPILSRATSPALAWCGRRSNRGTRPLFGGGLVVPVSDDVMIHIDLPRQARDKQTTKTAHKKDLKTTFKLKKTVVVVVARQGCTSLTSFVIGTEYSVRKQRVVLGWVLAPRSMIQNVIIVPRQARDKRIIGKAPPETRANSTTTTTHRACALLSSQPTSRSTAIKAGWSYWSLLGGIAQSFGAKVRVGPNLLTYCPTALLL